MTTVEWLWKALLDSGFEDIKDVEGFYYQAIEMEKEQIIKAYETNRDIETIQTGEEYYNETIISQQRVAAIRSCVSALCGGKIAYRCCYVSV